MRTNLLLYLENRPAATQKEMAEYLKDTHSVSVTTSAISQTLRDMDITWKQVCNIPASWNQANLLEQRANFVNCQALDVDCLIVFVDESGFDLHMGRSCGYAPSGEFFFSFFFC